MWGVFEFLLPLASLWELEINSTLWMPLLIVHITGQLVRHVHTSPMYYQTVYTDTSHYTLYLFTLNYIPHIAQSCCTVICSFPKVSVLPLVRLPPGSKSQGSLGQWRETMTEESGNRDEQPRRRKGNVPVMAVIRQGDIRQWKATAYLQRAQTLKLKSPRLKKDFLTWKKNHLNKVFSQ